MQGATEAVGEGAGAGTVLGQGSKAGECAAAAAGNDTSALSATGSSMSMVMTHPCTHSGGCGGSSEATAPTGTAGAEIIAVGPGWCYTKMFQEKAQGGTRGDTGMVRGARPTGTVTRRSTATGGASDGQARRTRGRHSTGEGRQQQG